METCGKNWKLYGELKEKRPLVMLNTVADEGEKVWLAAGKMTDKPFALLSIPCPDWNRYMTPWPFRDFGGEADTYIGEIGKTVESLEITPAFIGIAGYSLGGLFALYSMYRTTLFSRFASASGSLWYPGFSDFVLSSKPLVKPERIYLSLGDKEPKAGNALMRSVGERTAEIFEHYQKECFSVRFESNPGNHFTDTEKRMAKGITAIL